MAVFPLTFTNGLLKTIQTPDDSQAGTLIQLNSGASVNLKTVGNTTLYTATDTTLVSSVLIVVSSITAISAAPVVSLGITASGYEDILPAQTLTGITTATAGEAFVLPVLLRSKVAEDEDAIVFRVSTGATGTTLSASVYLFGVILA